MNAPFHDLDLRGAPPPPIGAVLEAELRALPPRPTATRRPRRQVALIIAVSLGWAMAMVGLLEVRVDLHELPRGWLLAYLAAWLGAFAAPTTLLVVPARGSMLPRWAPAAAIAAVTTVGFVVCGLTLAEHGPSSLHRGLASWAGCLSTGMATALVPMLLMGLALRGVAANATRTTAVAIGAAAGAVGGFMLHLHCRIADGVHLGVIHGGVAVISAVVGGLLLPRWLKTP